MPKNIVAFILILLPGFVGIPIVMHLWGVTAGMWFGLGWLILCALVPTEPKRPN